MQRNWVSRPKCTSSAARGRLVEEADEETGEVRWVWKGIWKNSYHFIIENLYGETCDDVKQLFMPETLRTGVDDDLKGFDLVVYSTCQQLRMPLCSKRDSGVTLRRINADPFDPEDDLTASFADDDVDAILPSLVTVFDKTKSTMHLLKPGTLAPGKEKRKRTSSQASLDAASGRNARPHTTSTTATPLTYSLKLAREVAGWLVALHPDHVAAQYDSRCGATSISQRSPGPARRPALPPISSRCCKNSPDLAARPSAEQGNIPESPTGHSLLHEDGSVTVQQSKLTISTSNNGIFQPGLPAPVR